MIKFLKIAIPCLLIISCQGIADSKQKFDNNGIVIVLNGRNETDSLKYSCDSCYEVLQDKAVFDTIITIATTEAKDVLRNKLSFKPISLDLKILKQDSVYYTSGKIVDSLVAVIAKYKCIGKNAYGVEDEVESTSLIYLINNQVTNLDGKIKKQPLSLGAKGTVSRILSLYNSDGDEIIIQPVVLNEAIHLILTTNESCVEDSRLTVTFIDDQEASIKSWNKFNCNNTSYFKLSAANVQKMKTIQIRSISFSEDNFVFCSVPENERDYFVQFTNLVK